MMTLNEIKKELLKNKSTANFSHYTSGNLYYNVVINGELYQFPIPTVEKIKRTFDLSNVSNEHDKIEIDNVLNLSSDLGTTSFYSGMRASELNRWIAKAFENGEFVKIS